MSYRVKLEKDLADNTKMSREVLKIFWRLNPVSGAAFEFDDYLDQIDDNTSPAEKVEIVVSALNSIELEDPEEFMNSYIDLVREVASDGQTDFIKRAGKQFPQLIEFLEHRCPPPNSDIVDMFSDLVHRLIRDQEGYFDQQVRHFDQLVEYFPRYEQIMSSTGILKGVIAFAAGYFGGPVGIAGIQIWDNWQNSSDEDFMEKFVAGINQFIQAGMDYSGRGEDALEPIIEKLLMEEETQDRKLFDALEELEDTGWDVEPLYHLYRDTFKDEEEGDGSFIFDLALRNLADNSAVSMVSITNIRAMWGID